MRVVLLDGAGDAGEVSGVLVRLMILIFLQLLSTLSLGFVYF